MTATPGNVIDFDFIRKDIIALSEQYDIQELAFDRWSALQLTTQLEGEGLTMVPFGQGFGSMSAPTKEMEALILSKNLIHSDNPVLRWMFSNMIVKSDEAGNHKPDKKKSREKIDGMVAAIMALGRASLHKEVAPLSGDIFVV